jgi:lysophospholipase L1-like esterase
VRPFARTLTALALGIGLAAVPAMAGPAGAFAAPSTDYVALGDSYSAGTGTNDYDLNASCQRSSLSYPALWAAQQGTASFTFAACSGATTSDVRGSQLAGLDAGTDLVTITIGGNDAGFVATVLACRLGTQRTAAAGGTYLDARAAYAGHEVCSGSAWLNGTTLPITDSYHPNRSGYALAYLPLLRGTAT